MIKTLLNGEIKLYDVETLSEKLGATEKTIRRYITTGKMSGRKIGRRYYVSKDSLIRFVNGQK